MRYSYDIHSVWQRVPELMGLSEMKLSGTQWEGPYYIDGGVHRWRADKLKVYRKGRVIRVSEEGGDDLSLVAWMCAYGGYADELSALKVLRQECPISWGGGVSVARSVPEMRFVPEEDVRASRLFPLEKCPLFVWMTGLFGESSVRSVWDEYGVASDGRGEAVFWYRDAEGKCLHDKRIRYCSDGHRDKTSGASRRYRVRDGYSGRCLFGAHLYHPGTRVYVVESEKTALLFRLRYGRLCLATGGKGGIRCVEAIKDSVMLLPDMDARDEWARYGEVRPWWEKVPVEGEKWDIGDSIVLEMLNKNDKLASL